MLWFVKNFLSLSSISLRPSYVLIRHLCLKWQLNFFYARRKWRHINVGYDTSKNAFNRLLCTDDLKVISIRSSLFIVKFTVVVRQNKMINKPEIMGNAGSPFFFSLTRTFSVNTEPDWYDSERWWVITRWSMPNIS